MSVSHTRVTSSKSTFSDATCTRGDEAADFQDWSKLEIAIGKILGGGEDNWDSVEEKGKAGNARQSSSVKFFR